MSEATGAGGEAGSKRELFESIDAEAIDAEESADSKVIYDALERHAASASAAAELPSDDQHLSERIHEAANQRSREIRANTAMSRSLTTAEGRPIPGWLWLLWALAIVGALVALGLLWR